MVKLDESPLTTPLNPEGPSSPQQDNSPKASLAQDTLADMASRPTLARRFKASELDTMQIPEPRWAVEGLLPPGLCLLVGKPKLGKSWLSMNLASAIACGNQFLEQQLEAGDALYLVLEDHHHRLRSRLRKMLSGPLPERLEFWLDAPVISPRLVTELEGWVKQASAPRIIIIDPLGRVTPHKRAGASDYEAFTESLSLLQALAFKYGICVLLVHHGRKNAAEGGDVFDSVLGSIGINGVMDGMLLLERGREQQTAVLNVTGRDVEERHLTLSFDSQHGQWVLAESDALDAVPVEQFKVLDALYMGHRTPSAIAIATKKNDKNVFNMLGKLMEKGAVQKLGTGEYDLTPVARQSINKRRYIGVSGNLVSGTDSVNSLQLQDFATVTDESLLSSSIHCGDEDTEAVAAGDDNQPKDGPSLLISFD